MVPRTTTTEGYAQHCMPVGHANAAMLDEMQHAHSEALSNLATATAADRQTVGALSATNATLTTKLTEATATIQQLQQRIVICTCAAPWRPSTTHNVWNQPPQPAPVQAPTQQPLNPRRIGNRNRALLDPNGYCWSHGYRVSVTHSSRTCDHKLLDHQDDATQTNPMGGSTKNKTE